MPAEPAAAGGGAPHVAVLVYGDTERSPAMRHEIPVAIGDRSCTPRPATAASS